MNSGQKSVRTYHNPVPHSRIQTPAQTQKGNRMLFLIGHGVQSPLSAIRWGCSRLEKMTKSTLTKEQGAVLGEISAEAKILSGMLHSLLLVAKVDDGSYAARPQSVYLCDFLKSFRPLKEIDLTQLPQIVCDESLMLEVDRGILEAMFEAVAVIMGTTAEKGKPVTLTVVADEAECHISMLPALELSFLKDVQSAGVTLAPEPMVGGEAGLMLSVLASLCRSAGAAITLKKKGKAHHLLTLSLPLRSAPPSHS